MTRASFRLQALGATIAGLLVPATVFAQGFLDKVKTGAGSVATKSGLDKTGSLQEIIGNVIFALLSFSGILLLGIMLYAGFLWMTAGGDTDQIKKARQYIQNAIIGLIIITASYAIVNFVLTQLSGATGGVTGASDIPG